jgi:hypothetical protein
VTHLRRGSRFQTAPGSYAASSRHGEKSHSR